MNLINLVDLYGYKFFDGFNVPEPLDREIAINTIMDLAGELTPLYPEESLLTHKIEVWSARNQRKWKKITESLYTDYDIFSNTIREENVVETHSSKVIDKPNETLTRDVSAFDSNTYQPKEKTNTQGENENTRQSEENRLTKFKGNIGASSMASLATAEINFRKKYEIYHIIAGDFIYDLMLRTM